jgi:hypothetical protein
MKIVLVMLSTTDMLGTQQVVGNQIAQQSALVQQVQRLGRQIDGLTQKITNGLEKNEALSPKYINQSLKNIIKQLGRLQSPANPPQMQPLIRLMLDQVKDLPRQLPIRANTHSSFGSFGNACRTRPGYCR